MNDTGGKNLLGTIRKWRNCAPAIIFNWIDKKIDKKIGFKNLFIYLLVYELLELIFLIIFKRRRIDFFKKIEIRDSISIFMILKEEKILT